MAFDTYTLRQMLKEHGQTLTLRKRSAGTYNNDTGKVIQTNTDYSVVGYFYDFTPDMVDDESILRTDRRVVLSPLLPDGTTTPQPDATDQIINGSVKVDVIKVSLIKSGTSNTCYLLHVRG